MNPVKNMTKYDFKTLAEIAETSSICGNCGNRRIHTGGNCGKLFSQFKIVQKSALALIAYFYTSRVREKGSCAKRAAHTYSHLLIREESTYFSPKRFDMWKSMKSPAQYIRTLFRMAKTAGQSVANCAGLRLFLLWVTWKTMVISKKCGK